MKSAWSRPRPRAVRSKRRMRRRRSPLSRRRSSLADARSRLRQFRQASMLTVAVTGLLLLLFAPWEEGSAADTGSPSAREPLGRAAAEEAERTFDTLWYGLQANLPKFLVVLGVLALAWLLVRLLRPLLLRSLARWERANAVSALFGIAVWILATGISLSILAGDIRALVGSVGLVGLALSWALQTPIESFTGWLLNSFQGYYKVGDRVAVGEVFGDVTKIDFLTTTVWEIGSPLRDGFVRAEQPTGRLITFPNNEVLTGTVVNLTRDFPFVWDELAVPLANESDFGYGMEVLGTTARDLLGARMVEPARQYSEILRRSDLESGIPEGPEVFLSMNDSWTDVVIRYLVHARQRRKWKSELIARVSAELNREEHAGRLLAVYPRQQLQFVDPAGRAVSVTPPGERAPR